MSSAHLEKLCFGLFLVFASVNLSSAAGTVTPVSNCSVCDTFATCTTVNSTLFQCECDANFTGNGTSCVVSLLLECATSVDQGFGMRISLNKTYFDVNSISQGNLRLLNESCVPTLVNGFYVFETPSFSSCGSVQSNDSNNVIYSNAVSTDKGITVVQPISIPVSCMLATNHTVEPSNGNDSAIAIVAKSILHYSRSVSGIGQFYVMEFFYAASFFIASRRAAGTSIIFDRTVGGSTLSATMFLFKDSNYASVYNGIPLLTTTDTLYAMVELSESVSNLNLVIKECWATPDVEGLQSRHNVIDQPGCINNGVQSGLITKNGIANDARFQFQIFQFISFDAVYLHCDIQLCSSGNCIPSCSSTGRKKRDVGTEPNILRSTVIIKTSNPLLLPNSEDTTEPENNQFWITIVLLAVAVTVILICVFIILYLLRTRLGQKSSRNSTRLGQKSSRNSFSESGKPEIT